LSIKEGIFPQPGMDGDYEDDDNDEGQKDSFSKMFLLHQQQEV
jgi:hypothetical protein